MRLQHLLKEFKIVVTSDGKIELKDAGSNIGTCRLNLDPLRVRTIEAFIDMLREERLVRTREYQTLGANLYSVLLENAIGQELIRQVDAQAPRNPLRVNLEFEAGPGSKGEITYGLECWPWEYLFYEPARRQRGRSYFLATTTKLTLTRSLWVQGLLSSTVLEEPPLRVLFFVARPSNLARFDPKMTENAVENFKKAVTKSLAERFPAIEEEKLVEFESWIDPDPTLASDHSPAYQAKATWERFRALVLRIQPNVVHFLGHGDYDEEDGTGRIAFTLRNGEANWIRDDVITETLELAKDGLKLVFLQACESGSPPKGSYNPYRGVSGIGLCLAKCDIPAVVAMQYNIKPRDADIFAEAFYEALAENEPIDVAVQSGRNKIAEGRGEAFGLPVLYSRKPGTLFPDKPAGESPRGYNPATAPVGGGPMQGPDPEIH